MATSVESHHDPYPMTDTDDERPLSAENRNESLASFGVSVAQEVDL
jgi:hypothetical protein